LSTTPTAVKVAVIAPWFHHSQVKSASLKWECIPNLASPCKITLQNLNVLPQQDSASQETTGDQEWRDYSPTLVIPGSWLVYVQQKLEDLPLQQDKQAVFHTSYLTVMHCHPLSVLMERALTLGV
jgi:hypothetical protein